MALRGATLIQVFRLAMITGWLAIGSTGGTQADQYPSKPVRVIVPFAAGGPTDISARIVTEYLTKAMGRPFVVENRPGAGGNVGAQLAAQAKPDGYTLFWAQAGTHGINPSLYAHLSYDAVRDFAPVGLVAEFPLVLLVNPNIGVGSVEELIALAHRNPGRLNFGSGGIGTPPHMTGELFAMMTGIQWTHVPYKGSAPALVDAMSGVVDVMMDGIASALPHVRAGKLKAIGVTSRSRIDVLPDVPAIAESVPGYEVVSWMGLAAPAGTAPLIVERLSNELRRIAAMSEVQARHTELGMSVRTASPSATAEYIRTDISRWRTVVERTGAKVQ